LEAEMSGSHFSMMGLNRNQMIDFICEIEKEIESCGHEQRTVNHMCDALRVLKLANVYLERIDYYLDYDDGEDAFNRRLPKQLEQMVEKKKLNIVLKELRYGWQGK
jgi:hypothetical protein